MTVANESMSRRSLVKGLGAVAAVGALAGLTGCAEQSGGAAETLSATGANSVNWDEECEVIVVGAGAAGLAAAVTVADETDAVSCLVLEKGATPAGNSAFSNGNVFFTDEAHESEYAAYLKELAGEYSVVPGEVMDAVAHETTALYDWAVSLGAIPEEMSVKAIDEMSREWMEFEHCNSYGNFNVGHATDVEITGPKHIHELLLSAAQSRSDVIEYRTNTPFESLIVENGAVVGVVADGKNIRATRGVVMACGGFESDPELMETYFRMAYVTPSAGEANTGDGHRACAAIGAAFWRMHAADGFWMHPRNKENTAFAVSPGSRNVPKNLGITVGSNGRRFYCDYDAFATVDPDATPDGSLSTSVGSRHGYMQIGGEWGQYAMPSKGWFVFDADALAEGAIDEKSLEASSIEDLCYVADSLSDLAAQLGIPEGELERTVETWNASCDAGFDGAFYRPASTLTPIRTAPFYAQLCVPTMLSTNGGPQRNASGQVLHVEGEPIEGLYAAGEFGSCGGNLSEALCTGRIAGRSCGSAVSRA